MANKPVCHPDRQMQDLSLSAKRNEGRNYSTLINRYTIGIDCEGFYSDQSFSSDANGNLNLWRLYNLFTGANKSSYIDNFVERSINAYSFTEALRMAVQNNSDNWFLA